MEKNNNEVLLTVKELHALGAELNSFINEIDLANIAIEGLDFAKRKDQTTFLWIATKYFNTAYALNEKLSSKLDDIACMLLNCHDAKELGVIKND